MAKQQKRLVAHENLIYDVICRQAGTLSKAILEGVMNSIDAGATRIDVILEADCVVITDNGTGFRTEQEIDEWFAMFGTPHQVDSDDNSTDARYGRFRMGRGQLFAFGKNTWRTNEFVMEVDVKHRGLDFDVEVFHEIQHRGCSVKVALYDILEASALLAINRDVRKFCKYVDIPLYLDQEQINVEPKTQKWDYETEDGWIKVISSGEGAINSWRSGKGVEVYQQGVYVETIPEYEVGIGGTIVTKAPLKLNFARNQVMRSSCPRWKRMYKLLKSAGQDTIKLKTNLDANERLAMIDQLRNGELRYGEARALRLFLDVQNKTWSANQLKTATSSGTKFALQPNKKLAISFAPVLSHKADKIMQENRAVIFDEGLLEQWQTTPIKFITDVLYRFDARAGTYLDYVPLELLDATTEGDYRLLADKELTKRERVIMDVLDRSSWDVRRLLYSQNEIREPRILRAGQSNHAMGWTDGSSYIAINIDEIRKRAKVLNWANWFSLARLMLHEYCHAEPDTSAHSHDAHFYQLYHDASRDLGPVVDVMFRRYMVMLQNKNAKIPQSMQLMALKETQVLQQGLAIDMLEAATQEAKA
jgi:hypothetical protein